MWLRLLSVVWLSAFLLDNVFSKVYEWDVLLTANTKMDLEMNNHETACMDSLNEHLNYTIHIAWEQFKQQFERDYSEPEEQYRRLNVFCKNFMFIRRHNKAFEDGKELYKLGINQFSDKTNEEAQHSCVSDEMLSDISAFPTRFQMIDAQPPRSIDWRQRGAVTPVRHQGECGSCWAMVVAGVIESHDFLHNKYLYTLSPQQLLDCSSSYGTMGCNGGHLPQTFRYVNQSGGLEREVDYPYVSGRTGRPNPKCNFEKSKVAASIVGLFSVPLFDEKAMTQAVGLHGPVTIIINTGLETFTRYGSGIYDDPNCRGSTSSLTHAMMAIGYGEENGVPYWIIKNTWGTYWGENGYMRIRRNVNRCGVAVCALYPRM